MKSSIYRRFAQIDGAHDFRKAAPVGYVDYAARVKRGGKVIYFNFALAREMGLIPANHDSILNSELSTAILNTFSIQIINEYDILHHSKIPKKDLLNRKYMATRYLQLQHPNRQGKTSGDGRSIWNGQITTAGTTWDVTSCGTGATCLSPAAATLGFTPRTGDPKVSYGCGTADIDEGIAAAIQSEVFHNNGVLTERTLAVIAYQDKTSINVRAGRCLLRPSHFFYHLKQENHSALQTAIDYFIHRQIKNGDWHPHSKGNKRYFELASHLAIIFARMAATFESEYIFVWMDWDGDNLLATGGIIDYGSVRQFGLYHHAYRFDDGDRWSTTIPEQKMKARALVQGFIQIADFLCKGKKRNLNKFRNHSILKAFDREFEKSLLQQFLRKNGFTERQQHYLLGNNLAQVRQLHASFSYFEKAQRIRLHRVPDGITRDAIYCMRDLLRELPSLLLLGKVEINSPKTASLFLEIIASAYATRKDRKPTATQRRYIRKFLRLHQQLIQITANKFHLKFRDLWSQMATRSTYLNPRDRLTGESVMELTDQLLRARKRGLKQKTFQRLIEELISCHTYSPETLELREMIKLDFKRRPAGQLLALGLKVVQTEREGL